MTREATRKGASQEETETDERKGPQPDLARFNEVEDIAENLRKARNKEIEDQIESDPGFKALQEGFEREMEEEEEEEEDTGDEHPEDTSEEETEEEDTSEEETEEEDTSEEEEKSEKKPGKEKPGVESFITEDDNGVPSFRAKIDGKEVLIPLDRAQAQLQKREAAELRLQQAARERKQLEQREQALRENEQLLRERFNELRNNPLPQGEEVDDEALQQQAKDLVDTIFHGSEDEAAAKLAQALKRNRAPERKAPAVNQEELVRTVKEQTRRELEQEEKLKDSKKGFQEFQRDYADILADPYLFTVADGMTDEIAAEHPDWMPSEVMKEAGRRTREWREGQRKAGNEPGEESQEAISEKDRKHRQNRKSELTPVPSTATRRPPKEPEKKPQTPRDVVREMREARHQPV